MQHSRFRSAYWKTAFGCGAWILAVLSCHPLTSSPGAGAVASVLVSPPSATLQVGSTLALTATPQDSNHVPLTGRPVTWSSSNTAVATVNGGLVAGVAAGVATITATSEGKDGRSSITVTAVPVASVTVSPPAADITVGGTVQLVATLKDANGNPLSGRVVAWASSNSAVAGVNGSGLVTGVATGAAMITASSEGESGISAISVTATSGTPIVIAGAGDITGCSQVNDEATAKLLDSILPDVVYTTGDNVYPYGLLSNYQNCYDPTWGRHKARTKPTPGNHDYDTQPGAPGYYQYFGALAGDSGVGYYSYDVGNWHLIALNSNTGGPSMSAGSAQETWLKADLAASTKPCTIAYWHHPRWSSGTHGSDTRSSVIWQDLYNAGAEIVLNGHDHVYERFAPQNPDGQVDVVRGIREFVVGMGGEGHYSFNTPLPNSEVRDNTSFGVLKLTLYTDSYAWEFVPIAGATFRDSGSGTCH
jgi:Bacterial Ig-like domain (group 2)/Calcineurin-like phosphoesterase